MRRLIIIAGLIGLAAPASAAVKDAAANGFTVRETVTVDAPADKVWAAMVKPSGWWSPAHTYSRSAAGLSLDPRPGGCMCEALPGGGVQHMSVVYADPRGHSLRMVGGLGPLQALGVSGSMTWMLRGTPGQTTIIFEYAVGGYMAGGLDKVAPMVDQVLDEQAQRLAKAVTTGKPD